MIFTGLCDGTVKIINNPKDDTIACQIGTDFFYFISSNSNYRTLSADEIYESFTKEQLTEKIYSALQNLKDCCDSSYLYYLTILQNTYNNSNSETNKLDIIYNNIQKLLNESNENLKNAAAGYDEGWFVGEVTAYDNVLSIIKAIREL